ncbi:GNAT family N-acetyltransferase [Niveibacterium umoris]|uniref:RimJ/RimL family protein N-acetyltransferase n=1 Tax=Niveibacterium umoris TaxID=1193620 RepID=A0A840BNW6_9RHOO|nr:GNAT family N-acetyltransferase [Niveibacterium umoris]MBB4013179.1 RimJ/RimL family protein N-acetyltransferase [Niveibacterium umoris]
MNVNIETERLRLRPFTEDDLDAFHRLGTDPDAIRYVGNTPFRSREEALEVLRAAPLADYATRGFGRFACEWKESGEVIGFSGLKYIPEFDEIELGYRFLPAWWGKGLATEAGHASIAFAKATLHLQRVISLVDRENVSAAKVLRKLGFAYESDVEFHVRHGGHIELWSRTLS